MTIGLPELGLSLQPALLNQWVRVPKAIEIARLHDRVLRP